MALDCYQNTLQCSRAQHNGHVSDPAGTQEVSKAKRADWSPGKFLNHPFQQPHVSTEGSVAMFALLLKALGVRNKPYSAHGLGSGWAELWLSSITPWVCVCACVVAMPEYVWVWVCEECICVRVRVKCQCLEEYVVEVGVFEYVWVCECTGSVYVCMCEYICESVRVWVYLCQYQKACVVGLGEVSGGESAPECRRDCICLHPTCAQVLMEPQTLLWINGPKVRPKLKAWECEAPH